jgi:hypothetical protein
MSDNNTGFGRRQAIPRESLKTMQAAPAGNGRSGFPVPAPVRGLLIGFGIVGLLFAVHVATMKGFGRALDRHWAENAGYPGVEDAYRRSAGAGSDKLLEQVHNDCKSRSDFVGRNRPNTRAEVMSGDDVILGRSVTYLSCLANEKPARFCEAPHRSHLFAAIKDHYRLKAKMREEHVLMNSGPFAATRNALIGGPTREMFPTTSPMAAESDPRVIGALKPLIVGGYVTRRDLISATGGWPNDFDLVLRGVEPKQKGCA